MFITMNSNQLMSKSPYTRANDRSHIEVKHRRPEIVLKPRTTKTYKKNYDSQMYSPQSNKVKTIMLSPDTESKHQQDISCSINESIRKNSDPSQQEKEKMKLKY